MRTLLLLLLVASCARRAPITGEGSIAPVPQPVTLEVRGAGYEELLPAVAERARGRLMAFGHPVVSGAAHAVELEIVSIGGEVTGGAYLYCVRLRGQVRPRGAARGVEKCEYVRLSNVAHDPTSAVVHAVLATAKAVSLERARPDAGSKLFVAAVNELTDALGREATSWR